MLAGFPLRSCSPVSRGPQRAERAPHGMGLLIVHAARRRRAVVVRRPCRTRDPAGGDTGPASVVRSAQPALHDCGAAVHRHESGPGQGLLRRLVEGCWTCFRGCRVARSVPHLGFAFKGSKLATRDRGAVARHAPADWHGPPPEIAYASRPNSWTRSGTSTSGPKATIARSTMCSGPGEIAPRSRGSWSKALGSHTPAAQRTDAGSRRLPPGASIISGPIGSESGATETILQ
jgi:hypothetical protein